jgi:hypothetical protein
MVIALVETKNSVVRKSEKSVSLSIDENSIFLMKIVIVVYYAQDIGLF